MHTQQTVWFRVGLALALVLIGAFGLVRTAQAVEFVDDSTIPSGEVIDDDVFIAGSNVVIDGAVTGDLFATGATVTVNGEVGGSLVAAGQTIVVNGVVSGSIYAGSSSLELGPEAQVGRNLYYGGFSVETKPGSVINRDLLFGGYQAIVGGEVISDVNVGGTALEISGTVGGNVNADVGDPGPGFDSFPGFFSPPGAPAIIRPGIRVSDEAQIGGEVRYSSSVRQDEAIDAAPEGGVIYQTPVPSEREQARPPSIELQFGRWILERLRQFFTLMVFGALALWLIPILLERWTTQARNYPLPAAGWGLVTLLLGYAGIAFIGMVILGIGVLLSVITLGGLSDTIFGIGFSSLGLALTILNFLVGYGSKLVVAYLAGKMILQSLAPQSADRKIWPLLLGVSLYVLFRAIPIVGWFIGVIVTLIGLGAIWLVFQQERRTPAPVVA